MGTPPYGLENFADAVVEFRCRQQMNMISHPDIGMDRQTMLTGRLNQGIMKKLIIRTVAKIT